MPLKKEGGSLKWTRRDFKKDEAIFNVLREYIKNLQKDIGSRAMVIVPQH